MAWTGEDTKDVLKRVLGGVIVAAILALAYAVSERMDWYVSAAIGAILVLLVVAGVSLLGGRGRARPEGGPPGPTVMPNGPEPALVPDRHDPRAPATGPEGQEIPAGLEADEKAAKKAAKSDYKRRKKEAKAREKSS